MRLQSIVSEFVSTVFNTNTLQTIQRRIQFMQQFNSIELDELKQMLLDVINETSIKELVEKGDGLNAKLASDFYRKVVAAK